MMTSFSVARLAAAAASGWLMMTAAGAQPVAADAPALKPAQRVAHAGQAELLAVARAGQRLVAVGDHGVVLTSDDQGRHWQQAQRVPFDGLLTGVSFVDARQGWAVGHAGVILHTDDGGSTWSLQRSDTTTDRPLYAVHFFDAEHGVAVGLWSLVLRTEDGGRTWTEQRLPPPEGARKADLNLLGLFAGGADELFATAEKGNVLHSTDQGRSWSYLSTGYQGSFWCGTAMADGTLIVAGLRGSLYRSEDRGRQWTRVDTGTQASITALAVRGERDVTAVALDGSVLRSTDSGQHFAAMPGGPRAPLTALALVQAEAPVLLSRNGPLPAR